MPQELPRRNADESAVADTPVLPRGVVDALEQARSFGYLGPGPVRRHIEHALGFAEVAMEVRRSEMLRGPGESSTEATTPLRIADLGIGGGLPGLILAALWEQATFTFVDAHQRRMATLREVVASLGWSERIEIICERAETVGRLDRLRGAHDLVVARGFAEPAVTAECAAPLLRPGGILVVSEPPDDTRRWDREGLQLLAHQGDRRAGGALGFAFFVGVQQGPCPERYPRRVGIPAKRPLF